MGFISGDDVVHPNYGVGNIMRLEERQLAEVEVRQYYVLAFGKMTVWLPVQAGAASPLRLVTAPRELDQYRTLLKSCPAALDRDRPAVSLHDLPGDGQAESRAEVTRREERLEHGLEISGGDSTAAPCAWRRSHRRPSSGS